jgi:heme/copper-type cytochrome/quinol oxidase subunit 2
VQSVSLGTIAALDDGADATGTDIFGAAVAATVTVGTTVAGTAVACAWAAVEAADAVAGATVDDELVGDVALEPVEIVVAVTIVILLPAVVALDSTVA